MGNRPKLRLVSSDPHVAAIESEENRAVELAAVRGAPAAALRVSVALGAIEHLDMAARDRVEPDDAFDRLPVPLEWAWCPVVPTGGVGAMASSLRREVSIRVRAALEDALNRQHSIVHAGGWSAELDRHVNEKARQAFRRELVRAGVEGAELERIMLRVGTFLGWVYAVGKMCGEHRSGRKRSDAK